tara:strand:+ start:9542 stop:10480 length:939 start_codon:yes stop_codon:yes gene_type:complete
LSSDDSTLNELRARLEALLTDARAAGFEGDLLAGLVSSGPAESPTSAPPAAADASIPTRFGMVGDSAAMQPVLDLIAKVAPSSVAVLIQGETGTGKELVAHALHAQSKRSKKPFLAENCAAVPAELLESELFGHKKGSFTGAIADRPGHFLVANGGTVFLDEIGDMPLPMQAKLLRVLQDGEVRPVGSNAVQHVDVRVVAATNKDLPEACKAGTFREDLFYRLNVITIHLPPLRERGQDIAHLARFFLARANEQMGRSTVLSDAALEMLLAYSWPGNVRQLENEMQRAVALSGATIGADDLSPAILAESASE